MPKGLFETYTPPRKELPRSAAGAYRVYSDAHNYTLVEAQSAEAAFKASGLTRAFRIEREGIALPSVIKLDGLAQKPPPSAPRQQPAAAAEAEAPTETAAAQAAPEAPLTQEDVSKLLGQ